MAAGEKFIKVTVDKQGNTVIEAVGYPDGSCLKATENLEQALGKVQKRSLKMEASKTPTIADKTKIGGGNG